MRMLTWYWIGESFRMHRYQCVFDMSPANSMSTCYQTTHNAEVGNIYVKRHFVRELLSGHTHTHTLTHTHTKPIDCFTQPLKVVVNDDKTEKRQTS